MVQFRLCKRPRRRRRRYTPPSAVVRGCGARSHALSTAGIERRLRSSPRQHLDRSLAISRGAGHDLVPPVIRVHSDSPLNKSTFSSSHCSTSPRSVQLCIAAATICRSPRRRVSSCHPPRRIVSLSPFARPPAPARQTLFFASSSPAKASTRPRRRSARRRPKPFFSRLSPVARVSRSGSISARAPRDLHRALHPRTRLRGVRAWPSTRLAAGFRRRRRRRFSRRRTADANPNRLSRSSPPETSRGLGRGSNDEDEDDVIINGLVDSIASARAAGRRFRARSRHSSRSHRHPRCRRRSHRGEPSRVRSRARSRRSRGATDRGSRRDGSRLASRRRDADMRIDSIRFDRRHTMASTSGRRARPRERVRDGL